jgi:hypothetical protein
MEADAKASAQLPEFRHLLPLLGRGSRSPLRLVETPRELRQFPAQHCIIRTNSSLRILRFPLTMPQNENGTLRAVRNRRKKFKIP